MTAKAQNKTHQITLDDQWLFSAGDNKAWAHPGFDDAKWSGVTAAKLLEEQKGFENFDGFGWYRKHIKLPDSLKAEKGEGLVVAFQQVDDCDEFYFNGHFIGRTGSFPPNYVTKYNTPREYIVPAAYINFSGSNTIALRIYDGGGGGGLIANPLTIRNATAFDNGAMKLDVPDSDKIFLAPDPLTINADFTNNNKAPVAAIIHVDITTDNYKPLRTDSQAVNLKSGIHTAKKFSFQPSMPGFYRYTVYLESNGEKGKEKNFNLGYELEKIQAPSDAKPDFTSFWQNTLKELKAIAPDYQMTLQPQYSNPDYEVYEVAMNSLGNERVKGYYAKPKGEGKFPVTVEYQGYGSGPYPPETKWDGFAHMVMSVRGQGLNKPGNKYGGWIVYGLENKEAYYYRGAFMDVVRGIDFVCTRPEIDTAKIAAQGGSQGGAFTFVSAALDKRVKVCAPAIPFLSDYKDYFQIVPWPKSSFDNYRKDHPDVSWDHIYDVLTYFDIKNLAPWINCPLFMGIGVQDPTCPPHINFAAFNNVKQAKNGSLMRIWDMVPDRVLRKKD